MDKTLEDYLERKQGVELDFEPRGAVEDSVVLPRVVCGFLNARGGTIVVGIQEVMGGLQIDPLERPDEARRRVWDRLSSNLEPALPQGLSIEILGPPGRQGLIIQVPRSGDAVYAVAGQRGSYAFFRREDDGEVSMPLYEVLRGPAASASSPAATPVQSVSKLDEWKASASQALLSAEAIFLRLVAEPKLHLSQGWRERLEAWYRDPPEIGVRRLGGHFLTGHSMPQPVPGSQGKRCRSGDSHGGYLVAELTDSGELGLATRLQSNWFVDFSGVSSTRREPFPRALHPVILSELISASTMVCAALWSECATIPAGRVWAAFSMSGARGISLLPGISSPLGAMGFLRNDLLWQEPYPAAELRPAPISMPLSEFVETPHRLAWALLCKIYADFGYDEQQVPYYDRSRERFVYE